MRKTRNAKKLISTLVIALILVVIVDMRPALASVDQGVPFCFTVKAYSGNGREGDARHRDTLMVDNQWKVKMTWSAEPPSGDNTVTRFWLETNTGANVSPSVLKLEGGGYSYRTAYRDACNSWVWLAGENNAYNGYVYEVRGYWDEETGVAP